MKYIKLTDENFIDIAEEYSITYGDSVVIGDYVLINNVDEVENIVSKELFESPTVLKMMEAYKNTK